ncbi:MAG TPA: hypothetical protein VGR70_20855 [Stellaceae bacterium]|nr:hypothetical protein [Stellaceae bacterium]
MHPFIYQLRFAEKFCFAAAGADAGAGGGSPGGDGGGDGGGAAGGGAADGGAAGGGDVEAFLQQIPENIRGEAYFKDVKTTADLATRAFHQAKLVGLDKSLVLRLPATADDAEGWNGVYNQLGRPESADKYTLEAPKDLPEGLTIAAELQKGFASTAHQLGLTQKQVEGLFQWWNGSRAAQWKTLTEAETKAAAAVEKTIDERWGQAKAAKLAASETAIAHYDETLKLNGELSNAIKAMPAASRVALGELFAHLGERLAEDGFVGKGGEGGQGALSPTEARQEINARLGDKQFMDAYQNPRHPGHKDAVDKMLELHEFIAPTAEAA